MFSEQPPQTHWVEKEGRPVSATVQPNSTRVIATMLEMLEEIGLIQQPTIRTTQETATSDIQAANRILGFLPIPPSTPYPQNNAGRRGGEGRAPHSSQLLPKVHLRPAPRSASASVICSTALAPSLCAPAFTTPCRGLATPARALVDPPEPSHAMRAGTPVNPRAVVCVRLAGGLLQPPSTVPKPPGCVLTTVPSSVQRRRAGYRLPGLRSPSVPAFGSAPVITSSATLRFWRRDDADCYTSMYDCPAADCTTSPHATPYPNTRRVGVYG
ncbi:hypothetical protein B0H17DRAFT_1196734 [Mycena rosella]|uniref:Uncharacterized protein n=1 Tax=Mycena rosella TaxID=1033263 RepID=A0AAD7DV01_MYCRO|nr:hypothetical protein B0H17DRAFT_1196734 [Mycena rosella]